METIKVTVKSLKNNKHEIMEAVHTIQTADCYTFSVAVNAVDKFGFNCFQVSRDVTRGDLNKAERVMVWVENRYGNHVTLYTDSQDAFDDFDSLINVSTHYKCVYFRNETDLNPRNFAKIGK